MDKLLDAARKLCPQFGLVTAKAYDAQVGRRGFLLLPQLLLLLPPCWSAPANCCCCR